MATVRVIPASVRKPDILRVAAYCRVSSNSDDQLHSYAAQIRNYTETINRHRGWKLIDVYAEAGVIIGLNTARPLRHIGLRCFGSILQLFGGLPLWRHSRVRNLPV